MMIVAALPASQRHFSLPSAARRSRKALRSQGPHILSKRRARARTAHPHDPTSSRSSFPPRGIRAAGPRRDALPPTPTSKSP
jgi:hypothetical protein